MSEEEQVKLPKSEETIAKGEIVNRKPGDPKFNPIILLKGKVMNKDGSLKPTSYTWTWIDNGK
jgi:hypothetical protein